MKISRLPLFVIVAVTGAHAGIRVSGGGHSVVCRHDGSATTHQLLDLYEAEHVFSLKIDMPADGGFSDPNVRVQEKALYALERISALSPLRYQWYRQSVVDFFAQLSRYTSDDLRFVNDSYYEVLGKNCALEQAALQQERSFRGDPTFFVSIPHWNRFDLNSRAALLLHEIIYNELLAYGHADSVAARRIVGLLFSDGYRNRNLLDFLVDLHAARIPDTDIGGLWVRLWDFAADEDPFRSRKLRRYDDRLVQTVQAELYPNFEPTGYSVPNLFANYRTYNPFYEVHSTRLKVVAEFSRHLLPVEIQLNRAQKISSLRVRESNGAPASLWLQDPDGSWRQVSRIEWDSAGRLTQAQ